MAQCGSVSSVPSAGCGTQLSKRLLPEQRSELNAATGRVALRVNVEFAGTPQSTCSS